MTKEQILEMVEDLCVDKEIEAVGFEWDRELTDQDQNGRPLCTPEGVRLHRPTGKATLHLSITVKPKVAG